jgi:uncharacterized protein YjbI with pentapeptide repeats
MNGVAEWNSWRRTNRDIKPDLSGADLKKANLMYADLSGADLMDADLGGANLSGANLSGANLSQSYLSDANLQVASLIQANLIQANLIQANLNGADLTDADLIHAKLLGANLSYADLSGAELISANLTGAVLVGTKFMNANLSGCHVYGVSVWDVHLDEAVQTDLVVTPDGTLRITVDDLEIAQFIYLLLNNQKIRNVLNNIASKVVLILGSFTPERKRILDAIREELRKRNYLPVLFDFEGPSNRDITETVSTLAHMARFVIADITDAKSIPQELMKIVPALPSVPVRPILLSSEPEWAMFKDLLRYPWVIKPFLYRDEAHLLAALNEEVISPAEAKVREQTDTTSGD